jgi:hypothetical protein
MQMQARQAELESAAAHLNEEAARGRPQLARLISAAKSRDLREQRQEASLAAARAGEAAAQEQRAQVCFQAASVLRCALILDIQSFNDCSSTAITIVGLLLS